MSAYTDRQGQYLAFIHAYTRVMEEPPAIADIARFFKVTPPTAHAMVVELEQRQLVARSPGKARSIRVLLAPEDLPVLR